MTSKEKEYIDKSYLDIALKLEIKPRLFLQEIKPITYCNKKECLEKLYN